jgi:hypothetical protein
MAFLAGAGMALAHSAPARAEGKVVQVSFEDADKTANAKGDTTPKAKPQMMEPQPVAQEGTIWGGGAAVEDEGAPYGPPGRFWVSAEYLMWWVKNYNIPPLLTSSTASGALAGALGQTGTTILFGGGSALSDDIHSGARFGGGMWLDCDHTIGLEGSYFFLPQDTRRFTAVGTGAAGSSILGRPFTDATTGLAAVEQNAIPGFSSAVKVVTLSDRFQGADSNALYNVACGCRGRLDLLAGFRWLDLDEGLGIGENTTILPTAPALGGPFSPGNTFVVLDQFNTSNDFYGGQIGAKGELHWGRLFANGVAKVALGDTHEVVHIFGVTGVTTPAGVTTTLPGGLLALPTNIGRYSRERFAVVPEVGLHLGYQVSDHLRLTFGYTFIYWSNVVRPGSTIDTVLNSTRIPTSGATPTGAARPAFAFHDTDFWAQGLDFGVEVRY